mgnify:CR=1 FL=1
MSENSEHNEIVDSRFQRTWADNNIERLETERKRHTKVTYFMCMPLVIVAMLCVFMFTREGLDLSRVTKLFLSVGNKLSETEEKTLDKSKRITATAVRAGRSAVEVEVKREFLSIFEAEISRLEQGIKSTVNAAGEFDFIKDQYNDFSLTGNPFGIEISGQNRRLLSLVRYADGEMRLRGLQVRYQDGNLKFSEYDVFTYYPEDKKSFSLSDVPDDKKNDLASSVISYTSNQRSNISNIEGELSREYESSVKDLTDNIARDVQVMLIDPWGDAFRVLRYAAIILMIYAVFSVCMRIIVRTKKIADHVYLMRVMSIYNGSSDKVGEVGKKLLYQTGSNELGAKNVSHRVLLSKIFRSKR